MKGNADLQMELTKMWWDPILKQKFGKVNVPNFYSYVSVD
jgi:hypothetical protein